MMCFTQKCLCHAINVITFPICRQTQPLSFNAVKRKRKVRFFIPLLLNFFIPVLSLDEGSTLQLGCWEVNEEH